MPGFKVICESEFGGDDAEPEHESLEDVDNEMDGVVEDMDDYPVDMNDTLLQPALHHIDKDLPAEDEGIDERGQQALERVKKATLERYSSGSATGSVQASDRLMKELKLVYKSDNHKSG